MIAWWWLLVAVSAVWLALLAVGAVVDRELREVLGRALLASACLPFIAVLAVLTRLDLGVTRLSPDTLARFARMRSADETHPAWVFSTWKRGVIFLREWEIGEKRRPVVQLREIFGSDRKENA